MRGAPVGLLALCAFATLATDRVEPVPAPLALPPVEAAPPIEAVPARPAPSAPATRPATATTDVPKAAVPAAPPPAHSEPDRPRRTPRPFDPGADEAAVAEILARLSIRHTALPAAERVEVARTILRAAARHGLEPELVVAVIEVESSGYHLAVSHVGALGLMQLLPSTGEEIAGKLGIEWLGDDTLFDPVINVKLGTAYLRELTDRFESVEAALAAYNWGPGRIRRRLRDGMGLPVIYVEKVQRAYDRGEQLAARRS